MALEMDRDMRDCFLYDLRGVKRACLLRLFGMGVKRWSFGGIYGFWMECFVGEYFFVGGEETV